MVNIIHTSDWHLGQKFFAQDRDDEQQKALDWLLSQIQTRQIDVLLVAGDIFDTPNPSNSARQLYYQFLARLISTNCRQIIITGGNHDSPAMLEAPKELLESLRIRVIGKAPQPPENAIVPITDQNDKLNFVVAAIPFLRDRDLFASLEGETSMDREKRIKEAMTNYYKKLAGIVKDQFPQIPALAMGHLFATGAFPSGKQDNIYAGNIENIGAEQFPPAFQYVALGHLHKAQSVGGLDHIRYSGSMIPLSFSESEDVKSITHITFDPAHGFEWKEVEIPVFRPLIRLSGNTEDIKQSFLNHPSSAQTLTPWVEVMLEGDAILSDGSDSVNSWFENQGALALSIRLKKPPKGNQTWAREDSLEQLSDIDVFEKLCEQSEFTEKQKKDLLKTYKALRSWMADQEADR